MNKQVFLFFLAFPLWVFGQNKPDSVYVYLGKNKVLSSGKAVFYDETGRKIQENGLNNTNGDSRLDENDQAFVIDYVYSENEGLLQVEQITRHYNNNEWVYVVKVVEVCLISHPSISVERYDYMFFDNRWVLIANTIANEFNEKGLPVVYLDSVFDLYSAIYGSGDADVEKVERITVDYNIIDMPEETLYYEICKTDDEQNAWTPFKKKVSVYNEHKNRVKETHYYKEADEWLCLYEYDYTYDENGQITSEIIKDKVRYGSETYYINVYPSGNSNEFVADNVSQVRITLSDGWLSVCSDREDPFDVAVYNLQGILLEQQSRCHKETTLPMSYHSKGLYLVRVKSRDFVYVQKVVNR